jgi:hypothetical protein
VSIKPNFFVVGAAKAGTTSVYSWLKQHPEIFVPQVKEPSFFVHGYGYSNWEEYLKLFENGREKKAIGDTSASYLAAPEAPEWIHETLGTVKIIMVLRNPTHRAFSLHSWMVMEGYEKFSSFEKALEEEETRFFDQHFYWHNPEYFWDYIYFRSGLYFAQVKRYPDVFGSKNVKIFLFEEIVNSPLQVFHEICDFLEISTTFTPNFTYENPSVLPRFATLQNLIRTNFDVAAGKLRHSRLHQPVRSLEKQLIEWNKKIGCKPNMLPQTEKKLRQMYQEDVKSLSSLIGRELSNWI